ncbi:MerR family transcriptional regulator [Cellulomonas humilata]|uniref:MerR family transcriptional regulator n=1 Tax=Cellulomonas humilata TaxID=144055 RepID=A0A7Y6DVK1_9CELL|nr:MerR family transcriptional regulator [Cellulomonas humilata]
MKIGELSRRTGVSTRLLRYYEEQGLISPARTTNTYRTYDDRDVARVEQVVGLVRAGVPTRLARVLLDLEDTRADGLAASCTRQVAQMLAEELTGLDERIACLTRSRRTLCEYLQRTEHATAVLEGAHAPALSSAPPH